MRQSSLTGVSNCNVANRQSNVLLFHNLRPLKPFSTNRRLTEGSTLSIPTMIRLKPSHRRLVHVRTVPRQRTTADTIDRRRNLPIIPHMDTLPVPHLLPHTSIPVDAISPHCILPSRRTTQSSPLRDTTSRRTSEGWMNLSSWIFPNNGTWGRTISLTQNTTTMGSKPIKRRRTTCRSSSTSIPFRTKECRNQI